MFSTGTGTSEGLRCSTSDDAVKVTGWEAPVTTLYFILAMSAENLEALHLEDAP